MKKILTSFFAALTCTLTIGAANPPEFIDMGTSVLWATENEGTDAAHPDGQFFRPGAIGSISSGNGDSKLSQQATITVDSWSGDASLDAVTALYGEGYFTPTRQQYSELLNACDKSYETVEIDGVQHGVLTLTSRTTGNELRFTGIGYMSGDELTSPGQVFYLTSSGDTGTSYTCYYMTYNPAISWASVLQRKLTGLTCAYPLRAACKPFVKVTDIRFEESSITIRKGESKRITAVITPDNAMKKAIEWTSGAPDIATVDDSGTVTAVSDGECIITGTTTDGTGLSAACRVTVKGDIYSMSLIDMGTSVLWADTNLGVDDGHPRGRHYLAGGTSPYPESTSSWFFFHPLDDEWGGNPDKDAATAALGTGWSTPSKAQFEELLGNCDHKLSYSYTYNRMVLELTSRTTGNHLTFIGAGLYSFGNDHTGDYSDIALLTSSGVAGTDYDCHYVAFTTASSDDLLKGIKLRKTYGLSYAYSIRPVCDKTYGSAIKIDKDQPAADGVYNIHDISGRMLYKSVRMEEAMPTLSRGIYILTGTDGKAFKIKK